MVGLTQIGTFAGDINNQLLKKTSLQEFIDHDKQPPITRPMCRRPGVRSDLEK
jgi:hypothetical protein